MIHTRCKPLSVGDIRFPLSTDSLRWGYNLKVNGWTSWPLKNREMIITGNESMITTRIELIFRWFWDEIHSTIIVVFFISKWKMILSWQNQYLKKKQSVEGTHRFHVMNRSNPCVKTYTYSHRLQIEKKENKFSFIRKIHPHWFWMHTHTHIYISG